jgi:hypothetical protein
MTVLTSVMFATDLNSSVFRLHVYLWAFLDRKERMSYVETSVCLWPSSGY